MVYVLVFVVVASMDFEMDEKWVDKWENWSVAYSESRSVGLMELL